jgi:biopolymer transport protein ExbB
MSGVLGHYWQQGDAVSHAVAGLLALMSLLSWYTILSKAWANWRIRRAAPALKTFWLAPSLEDAIAQLAHADAENLYAPLAVHGANAADPAQRRSRLNGSGSISELITHSLRQELNRITARLEAGLTVLASIGATAPFVGLLGTVWGIYHALGAVSGGTVELAKLAGPVGEALIMTALGLAVAIPSVLAYNAFNRVNRLTLAEVDAFAYDLHAHLSAQAQGER